LFFGSFDTIIQAVTSLHMELYSFDRIW
jgi:hypothetical protein